MLKVNWFGPDAAFHHVGLAVKSIQGVLQGDSAPVPDPVQKVNVQFIDTHGVVVELLEPLGEQSPVARSLKEKQFLLHLCFRVPDLQAAMAEGRKSGFNCISKITPAPALNNKNIVWVLSPVFGLVELLEK